jgi:hypothetical protein
MDPYRFSIRAPLLAIATILSALMVAMPVYAQVKPGDLINAANADKVRDLVSPGVFYKVTQGMTMKIVPTDRLDWPPPYKDATEKYSSQVIASTRARSCGTTCSDPI